MLPISKRVQAKLLEYISNYAFIPTVLGYICHKSFSFEHRPEIIYKKYIRNSDFFSSQFCFERIVIIIIIIIILILITI